jgi:mannose-6-phosphate isomerase-like protein (cupin superfamily)
MATETTPSKPTATVFRYKKPEFESGKKNVKLARTDHLIGIIQVLKRGGETNLHSHAHMDGFWMVLSGRVRFYGEGNALIADCGPYEGVLLPRGCPYWFENVEDVEAELLQVEAFDRPQPSDDMLRNDRTNYEPPRRPMGNFIELEPPTKS